MKTHPIMKHQDLIYCIAAVKPCSTVSKISSYFSTNIMPRWKENIMTTSTGAFSLFKALLLLASFNCKNNFTLSKSLVSLIRVYRSFRISSNISFLKVSAYWENTFFLWIPVRLSSQAQEQLLPWLQAGRSLPQNWSP